jgi:hypothetical protein
LVRTSAAGGILKTVAPLFCSSCGQPQPQPQPQAQLRLQSLKFSAGAVAAAKAGRGGGGPDRAVLAEFDRCLGRRAHAHDDARSLNAGDGDANSRRGDDTDGD